MGRAQINYDVYIDGILQISILFVNILNIEYNLVGNISIEFIYLIISYNTLLANVVPPNPSNYMLLISLLA